MNLNSQTKDQVTLVTPDDVVIGVMDKLDAHRNPAQLHRAISVFLFRKNPETEVVELLVQQRSSKKIVGALQWANTVCGNVLPEESYETCAYRRLQVELGIISEPTKKLQLHPVDKFEYQVVCNELYGEHELDQIFVGYYDGVVVPNPEEVITTQWVSWEKIAEENLNWAPWFVLMLSKNNLLQKIRKISGEYV